jgi:two-component system phosphate regulon sensor histidine kinase PhoR
VRKRARKDARPQAGQTDPLEANNATPAIDGSLHNPIREELAPVAPAEDGQQPAFEEQPSSVQAGAVRANEQEIARYVHAAVENSSDAILLLNEHFQVRAFNPAVRDLLGWRPEVVNGRGCAEVLKCRNLNRVELCGTSDCPLVRVLQYRRALPNEELIIGGDPEHSHEVSVSVIPVDIGQGMHVVFNARDVAALKVATRVRENFVSMVSHELRTPLNSVHGFIDLLMMGHMGELTEEQHKYLGYAQDGVQQLISIVEDILFMTRSDSGLFEIRQQKVHLRTLAQQVITSLKPQALKAEVILTKDIPSPAPLLYADPQRLKQVLSNLVINAIKFTPPGGTVTISGCALDERMARISVIDTGFGIPPRDQPHVFERFYQSNHSMQSKIGGYGLGLTIADLIVEQHGGRIWFDTVVGDGTIFYFTVPLYRGQPPG